MGLAYHDLRTLTHWLSARKKFDARHKKNEQRPRCDAILGKLSAMGNQGKVQRVIRELVATLVEEVGADEAAHKLEIAAAQLRGAGRSHNQAAAHEDRTAKTQPRIVASR
jgi:hypothetical protein